MTEDADLWADIGHAIQTHRARLGLTQHELAARAGVGLRTVRNLEAGYAPVRRTRSYPSVEAALGWPFGTVDRWARQGHVDDPVTSYLDTGEDYIRKSGYYTDAEKQAMIDALHRVRAQQRGDHTGGERG